MLDAHQKPIALVLSGGGVRAMVFHLGLMRFLAERNLLEQVKAASTVSGGSLVLGLILQEANYSWPSSSEFLEKILPRLKSKLCSLSLEWSTLRQLWYPLNWKYLVTRANLLSSALVKEWGITANLTDLPKGFEWSINGTTAETGKRFRFKRETMGDYKLGYAKTDGFLLADALAVSAAFPGIFGPLQMTVMHREWSEWSGGNSFEQSRSTAQSFEKIHLYDGGVYDNLGLEPFFDCGLQSQKGDATNKFIIVSDAGAPLSKGFNHGNFSFNRLRRITDIISDQTRALRVRTFATFIERNPKQGVYIYIDSNTSEKKNENATFQVASFPTRLRKLTHGEFTAIEEHGYRLSISVEKTIFDKATSFL